MKLGIASALSHETPVQWAEQLKELGCESVVFPLCCNDNRDRISAYVESAGENGLTIAEVGIWNNMLDADPEKRKRNTDFNIRQLILADEIGAVCAVNIAGTPHGPRWDGGYRENFSDETFEMTVEAISYILRQANVKNTFFCIESMPWMIPSGPEEYLRLIKAVNHPRFAAHLDLVNMITSPRRYFFNDEFIRECFELLKGHIRSCHLKDIALKEEFTFQLKECAVGDGALDIELYSELASRENPDMPMIIEHLSTDKEYIESFRYTKNRLSLR